MDKAELERLRALAEEARAAHQRFKELPNSHAAGIRFQMAIGDLHELLTYDLVLSLLDENQRMREVLEQIRAECYPGFWVAELIGKALGNADQA